MIQYVFIVRWILNFVDQLTHENHKSWCHTNKSDFTVVNFNISCETTLPILKKLVLKTPWLVLFKNCVWQAYLSSNMATVTKNRNFLVALKSALSYWCFLHCGFLDLLSHVHSRTKKLQNKLYHNRFVWF